MFTRLKPFTLLAVVLSLPAIATQAGTLDTIGVNLLRTVTTNLSGAGVRVAQVESPESNSSPPPFEVNPAHPNVNNSTSVFVYHSSLGAATNYPNSVGAQSFHADGVAQLFYGSPDGVATNVSLVDNYEVNDFINSIVFNPSRPAIPARIVNQSYIFGNYTTPEQMSYDSEFDDYAATNGTLFISAVGNADTNYYAGAVNVPASCYNGIGVGAYGTVNSSVGPTVDNGRCKPDITAPADATSHSTPLVAGAAAVLRQAGLRGDGGSDTNSAVDMRTLKALLLNGAIKPVSWTNGSATPLDARFGSGVLNVFDSYMQLAGGKHAAIESANVVTNSAHPPGGNPANIGALSGWNFAALTSSSANDRVSHCYFNITNGLSNTMFTVTATLAWNRQQNQTAINDLDLFLYNCANSNLIAQSISGVDNVEHIYTKIPPGRYDLQVVKYGGNAANGNITSSETYALAWEFFALPLNISVATNTATISWPIYPTGFSLQSTPSLTPPSWATLYLPRTITNGTNFVQVPLNSSNQFFRLLRPD